MDGWTRKETLVVSVLSGALAGACVVYYLGLGQSKQSKVQSWLTQVGEIRGDQSLEKDKMLSEMLYSPLDSVLEQERALARNGCCLYNELNRAEDLQLRRQILEGLLGSMDRFNPPQVEPPFFCDYGYNITMGKNSFLNYNCVLLDCAPISIGDSTLLGPNCLLVTPNHPLESAVRVRSDMPERAQAISIGDRCWLGSGVIVLPGVSIGSDSVVAAGAVVTKNVPPNSLVVGVPARVVKSL